MEGRDDREVVFHFCNHHGIDNKTLFSVEAKLEDFLIQLAHEGDPLVARAHDAVDSIPSEERRFALAHRSKAAIHTWLAWQQEPGTALGQAMTKRYLDPTRDPAPAFRAWLLELFAPIRAT